MMPHPSSGGRLILLASLLATPCGPASAEGNRLLPFWGQPYPYGFVRAERPVPTAEPLCPYGRPRHWRGGRWRCEVVLHARD